MQNAVLKPKCIYSFDTIMHSICADFDDKNDDTLVEIVCFSLDFLVLNEMLKKSVK